MSFFDRTISDALAPAASIPVRRSPAVPVEEDDIESAREVDTPPVEEDAQAQSSPLRASGASTEPQAENDKDQAEDDPAPEVQTLRRTSVQSAPLIVDKTEPKEQEPIQRTPSTASHDQAASPRPRSPRGDQPSAHTPVHDLANEPLRAPAPLAAVAPDGPKTDQTSRIPPTFERASALSHDSRIPSAPQDTSAPAAQKARTPRPLSQPQQSEGMQPRPLAWRVPEQGEQGEGNLAAPPGDQPNALTPTTLLIATRQYPTPQTDAPAHPSTVPRGPIVEIGRLEVIVETPVAPIAAPTPPAPLPMPGADTYRFTRRL